MRNEKISRETFFKFVDFLQVLKKSLIKRALLDQERATAGILCFSPPISLEVLWPAADRLPAL